MSDLEFGKQLRAFRLQCHNPRNGKILSQMRLGELLGVELGSAGFSGAAISDWERGASKIHMDDRLVLISLLKVLNQTGGLRTLLEANTLLETGNYRALNAHERGEIFPEETQASSQSPTADASGQNPFPKSPPYNIFFTSPDDLQNLLAEAREGPQPAWPRVITTVLRKLSDQISVLNTFHVLLWLWLWVASYVMITPSLYGTFLDGKTIIISVAKYICASIILPPCIGLLTNTKDNPFWWQNETISPLMLRLYTYQGAFIGFHLGYFVIFAIQLLMYFLQVRLSAWNQFILVGFPLVMGYISSQVVPYNLWRAYGRLRFSDGAIFFVFILLGPIWGWFFFEFHSLLISPTTGVIVVLAAITLLVSLMTLQYQRKGNTIIPVHWWIILYSLILICQIILVFMK